METDLRTLSLAATCLVIASALVAVIGILDGERGTTYMPSFSGDTGTEGGERCARLKG